MATDPYRTSDDHKFGETVQEISERMSVLVREEIELAKAEVEVKAKTLARGAAIGAAAGVFAFFGLFVLLMGLGFVWWDYGVFDHLIWSFLLTAVIIFILAGLAAYGATRLFKKGAPPTPDYAIEEAQKTRIALEEARN